MDLSEST